MGESSNHPKSNALLDIGEHLIEENFHVMLSKR
jgi:hypothetical protein